MKSVLKFPGGLLLCILLSVLGSQAYSQTPLYTGMDFWLAIPYNTSGNNSIEIKIVSDVATTGNISTGLGTSVNFNVSPGSPFSTILPATHAISTNQVIENKAVHVTANADVTVFAGSIALGGGDAVAVIATPVLGQNHRILGYRNLNPGTFLIVGTQNSTTVTITPSTCATLAGNAAGVPFNVVLNQGQTYMVRSNCDVSGSYISADKPIQVFSHSRCSQVPSGASYCDFIWSTSLPTNYWGTEFVTGALGGRNGQDRFRVMANQSGTSVYFNGVLVSTLNAGQFYETVRTGGNRITSNNPIFVNQYAISNSQAGGYGDPAMIQLLPTNMFELSYRFATLLQASTATHWITIVSRTAGTGAVLLDGGGVAGWSNMGNGWSYKQMSIGGGEHTLTGDSLLHAVLYGFNSVNSYGTPIGGITNIIILPIRNKSLKGTHVPDKGNFLEWIVESECLNCKGSFDLIKSKDGNNYTTIHSGQADGSTEHFSFLDKNVIPGERWMYKIVFTDLNGQVSETEWISVFSGANEDIIEVFPTPFENEITININEEVNTEVSVGLFSLDGREILEKMTSGSSNVHIEVGNQKLAAGVYMLRISYNGKVYSQQVIKK